MHKKFALAVRIVIDSGRKCAKGNVFFAKLAALWDHEPGFEAVRKHGT
jgi:hypothetical protein